MVDQALKEPLSARAERLVAKEMVNFTERQPTSGLEKRPPSSEDPGLIGKVAGNGAARYR
jgi:hypothetical protein